MNNQLMELSDFIDAIPNALIIIDEQKTIRLVNHYTELLFIYSKNELLDKPIEHLLAESGPENFSEYYNNYLASFKTKTSKEIYCELMGLKQDKTEFPMELHLGAWNKKNQERLSIISFRDLTHHTQLCNKKDELEHSNRTKDQFLATMSHQLRTPLNAVLGFSEILLLKLPGDLTAEQEKQIGIIHKSGKHLLSLINDLSDLAKIDSGEVSFFIEEINLAELVLEIANSLKPFAEEKKLLLASKIPTQQLTTRSDKRLLTQIITNIVNNAIKFTDIGNIALELREDKNKFVLHVIDTGRGIKKEKMECLFEAFQQLFIAEKKSEGSGLGLHVSKKLADLIGVNLAATSEYGKGTHFFISIPRT